MGQLGQRIGLVHELTQLARAEELLDRSDQGFGIHQLSWGEGVGFTNRHPLLDDALQPVQANANLVLKQFTDRTDAAIAQVIDVIEAGAADIKLEVDQLIKGGDHDLMGEGAHRVGDGEAQLLVDLVAGAYTHLTLPTIYSV